MSFIFPAFFLIYVYFNYEMDYGLAGLLGLIIVSVLLIVGYRYISSAWRRDTLLVTHDSVILSEQKGFRKVQREFKRTGITELRYLDKPVYTPHPLAGKTFDFLGFQTQQQVIAELFGDHRIAFDYNGKVIAFGRKLYSWDYEKIQEVLFGITALKEELPWNSMTSWDSYWRMFDTFLQSLSLEKQSHIIREAKGTKILFSDVPDSWVDHRQLLKDMLIRYNDQLSFPQKEQLNLLIDFLSEAINTEV